MKRNISVIAAALLIMSLCSCVSGTQAAVSDEPVSEESIVTVPAAVGNAVSIDLGGEISMDCAKRVDGGIKITTAGVYSLYGTLENGSVTVDTGAGQTVLILNDVRITCTDGAAIKVKKGSEVLISLAGSSSISGGGDNDDAALISKSDGSFTVCGDGSITVNGTYKHGIEAAGPLTISGCALGVTSVNAGINGKSGTALKGADITVNSGTDGIRAGSGKNGGALIAEGGSITVTSAGDGVQAASGISAKDADIRITSGGGSQNGKKDADSSAKGIKSDGDITINGGTLTLDSSDDCLHSNGAVTVSGGSISISTGDDGIHADASLKITDGDINIINSHEGLESAEIIISGGNISIRADDDGINAAGGKDGSGKNGPFGGKDGFSRGTGSIKISGGYIFIDADGDGIDSNDTIEISGGVTLINGPTSEWDSAFDFESSAVISGGTLAALGSSAMAQEPTDVSGQGFILYNTQAQEGETTLAVCGDDGRAAVSVYAGKPFSSVLITSPDIKDGAYNIVTGAQVGVADSRGFARSAEITGGTTIGTVTVENGKFSSGGFGGFGGFGHFGGGRPMFDPQGAKPPQGDAGFDRQ